MLSSAKKLTKKIENNFQKLIENDANSGMGNFGELIFQKQEKYRQELVDYQLRNNISSVYWKTIIWKEEIFRFPVISEELEPFPRDWKICARYKQKLTNNFLAFCQKWSLPIVEELDLIVERNTLNEQNYVLPERVLKVSSLYKWCLLVGSGDKHIKRSDLGKYVNTYQIVFTNLIDHHSHEDDEDCLSFSGLQILTI